MNNLFGMDFKCVTKNKFKLLSNLNRKWKVSLNLSINQSISMLDSYERHDNDIFINIAIFGSFTLDRLFIPVEWSL